MRLLRSTTDCPRFRGDRGVALVEAVFVFPVVIAIVFAIMEYGLLFAAESTTASATRDAVRYGSANYAVSGSNQAAADAVALAVTKDLGARTQLDTPLKLVIYKVDPSRTDGGPAGGFTSCTSACFKYTWNGTGWTFDPTSPGWSNPAACITTSGSNAGLNTLDSIGAYLELQHKYITGAFGSSNTIKEHTNSRLEPLPSSQC